MTLNIHQFKAMLKAGYRFRRNEYEFFYDPDDTLRAINFRRGSSGHSIRHYMVRNTTNNRITHINGLWYIFYQDSQPTFTIAQLPRIYTRHSSS